MALLATALLGSRTGSARADGAGACDADWAIATYARVKPAVVRIMVSNGIGGTGFLFGDVCHVATALHVVDSGRRVRVAFADGSMQPAEVIGQDSDHDLAILQLSACTRDVAPLKVGAVPAIGAPVMAVGHPLVDGTAPTGPEAAASPRHGLLEWSATTGVVSARNERFVQTDTVIHPGSSGGPLVDCHGDVVGVIDQGLVLGIGLAVTTSWLEALSQKAVAAPHGYSGNGRLSGSVGLQFDIRPNDGFQGVSLSDALVIHDAWWLAVRLGYLPWGGPNGSSATVTNPTYASGASRLTIDAAFGPRFLLFPFSSFVMYLQIAAGGGFAGDQWTLTQLSLAPGGGAIRATSTDYRATRWEPLGMIGVFFGSRGSVELSYSYRVDVEQVGSSTSQISFALWL
jgi:S1-C subfamily serine protease